MNVDNLNFVNVLGYNVFNDDITKISFENKIVVNTISPNSFGIATNDPSFREALKQSDILTLDGEYFGLASLLLKGVILKKQQGPDNFKCFMKKANEISGKVFLLGSTERTLDLMKKRALAEYPNIQVESYSPPFKHDFSLDDNNIMIQTINKFEPDLLCIGLTAPKQEKWAIEHRDKLNVKVIISIGQVFDWYAGTMEEPNPIWSRFHLLWLIRTIKRPEILKRYPMVFKFFWYLLLNIIRIRKD